MDILRKIKGKISSAAGTGKGSRGGNGEDIIRLDPTVGEICERLGTKLPAEYADLREKRVTDVCLSHLNAIKGSAVLTPTNYPEVLVHILDKLQRRQPLIVFADRKTYEAVDPKDISFNEIPVVLLENARNMISGYIKPYRDRYKGKVVTITGSFGKTTTKLLCESVLEEKKEFFSNHANNNSIHTVAENIMKNMDPEYEYYIQEVGAVRVGTIETEATYLRPDISIVTNVRGHHLANYGSLENVFRDKMQIVEKLNTGGLAIVNFDDEKIAAYDYKCRFSSFGIETDKPVTYRGKNIVQNGELLEMDIEYSGGTAHAAVRLAGEYNAYNVLAAFAFGKEAGFSDREICESLMNCKMTGTRQNLIKYGSNTFFVDCYNVANETIINSMKVITGIKPENSGRRIAIVGAENSLGKDRKIRTEELGRELAKFDVDEIVCFGTEEDTEEALDRFGDAKTLYESIKESGFENVRLILTKDEMYNYLRKEIKKDDVVLFKCITYLVITIPIDKAFGTNYCLTANRVLKYKKIREDQGFKGYRIIDMKESVITGLADGSPEPADLVLPDKFRGVNLFGVEMRTFYQSGIRTLDMGSKLKVVMPGAFKDCTNLTSVKFSPNLMHIMRGAFRGCTKLKEVRLGKKIREIEVNAFDGCSSLEKVYIPASADVRIEKGAFPPKAQIIRE